MDCIARLAITPVLSSKANELGWFSETIHPTCTQKQCYVLQNKKRQLSNGASQFAKLKVNQYSPLAYHQNWNIRQMVGHFKKYFFASSLHSNIPISAEIRQLNCSKDIDNAQTRRVTKFCI